jgi:hypothetical protein
VHVRDSATESGWVGGYVWVRGTDGRRTQRRGRPHGSRGGSSTSTRARRHPGQVRTRTKTRMPRRGVHGRNPKLKRSGATLCMCLSISLCVCMFVWCILVRLCVIICICLSVCVCVWGWGRYGFCIVCGKRADHYCSQTKDPVCSRECKLVRRVSVTHSLTYMHIQPYNQTCIH